METPVTDIYRLAAIAMQAPGFDGIWAYCRVYIYRWQVYLKITHRAKATLHVYSTAGGGDVVQCYGQGVDMIVMSPDVGGRDTPNPLHPDVLTISV